MPVFQRPLHHSLDQWYYLLIVAFPFALCLGKACFIQQLGTETQKSPSLERLGWWWTWFLEEDPELPLWRLDLDEDLWCLDLKVDLCDLGRSLSSCEDFWRSGLEWMHQASAWPKAPCMHRMTRKPPAILEAAAWDAQDAFQPPWEVRNHCSQGKTTQCNTISKKKKGGHRTHVTQIPGQEQQLQKPP